MVLRVPPGGDQDRGPGFIACVIITTFAALITVCIRIYVRRCISHAVGWDDWTILLSMVPLSILTCPRGLTLTVHRALVFSRWPSTL